MKIIVMSRSEAVRYCYKPHNEQSVIVSICDPYMRYTSKPFSSKENGVVAVLPVSFADADGPGIDVYGRNATANDIMQDSDAKQIAEFVRKYQDKTVIVHCDAGISRSSGVAAAIGNYFNRDDSVFFDSGRYRPNMWCYRKMLNALYAEDGQ